MKNFALLALFVFVFGASATAAPKPLAPCTAKGLRELESSIIQWAAKEYPNTAYLLNKAGKVVGYFSWDDSDGMHAEVCDPVVHTDLTVSNSWYYWESFNNASNPGTWRKGQTHELQQDEGLAVLKVLKDAREGGITCEFRIIGWRDSGDNVTVRRDIVTFVRK